MPDTEPIPCCPFCGSDRVYEQGHAQFWCHRCGRSFDKGGVDEGGDYSDRNAAARIERDERREHRSAKAMAFGRRRV